MRMPRLIVAVVAALGVGALAPASGPAAPLPADLSQLPRPLLTFTGATQNESFGIPYSGNSGRPLAERCDLDGDGVDDLAAGALGYHWSVQDFHGRVFVARGGRHLGGGVVTGLAQTVAISGFEDSKAYGTWTECAGDFDGDGYDDLLVSSDSRGAALDVPTVYVVLGAETFFAAGDIDVSADAPGRAIPIAAPAGQSLDMASAVAVGDVTGDGRKDLAVIVHWAGKVYLVPGRAASGVAGAIDPTAGRELLSGTRIYPTFLTAVGDLDGDGRRELAISSSDFAGGAGRVSVISGAVLADDSEPSFDLATEVPGERLLFRVAGAADSSFGYSVAGVPDLNGDGLDELAVGSVWPYGDSGEPPRPEAAGQVHVVFGTEDHDPIDAGALGHGGYAITGPSDMAEFGASLAVSEDLDGDGLADLLVGAPTAQSPAMGPGTYAGRGYVIYGKADTAPIATAALAAEQGAVLYGTHLQNRLGLSVAAVGDVDGNGLPDLAFGGWTSNFTGKGEVRLVRPGELPPPGPPNPPTPTQPAPPGPGPDPRPAKPSLKRLGKKARVNGQGFARVARASCPADGGACTVAAPKRVAVKIAGQRYWAKVLAPKRIAAGSSAVVRVKLGAAAVVALGGAKLQIPLSIRLSNAAGSAAIT